MNWGYARSWTAPLGWGDWPAWLACLAAVVALVISIRAQRDGRRSANAAEKSVAAAEASGEEARWSRLASERSATVAEETPADQRREAAERRAAEEEASRPRVDLRVEYSGGGMFLLFNQGAARAENIRAVGEYPAMRSWPAGLSLSTCPERASGQPTLAPALHARRPPTCRLLQRPETPLRTQGIHCPDQTSQLVRQVASNAAPRQDRGSTPVPANHSPAPRQPADSRSGGSASSRHQDRHGAHRAAADRQDQQRATTPSTRENAGQQGLCQVC